MAKTFNLRLENISKEINKNRILDNISFECKSGQIIGIVGPNGAGKSSLFKIISHLWKYNNGNIYINSESLENIVNETFMISSSIENVNLYENLSGKSNVEIIKKLYTLNNEEYINLLLKKFKLTENINKKVSSYSLGMKQKLGLILTLIPNSDLMILDEPTNSLDIESVKFLHDLIFKLKDEGKLVLISSHILEELDNLCDKIYILSGGKIVHEYNKDDDCNIFITFNEKISLNKLSVLIDLTLIQQINDYELRICENLLNDFLPKFIELGYSIKNISKSTNLKYEFEKCVGGFNE